MFRFAHLNLGVVLTVVVTTMTPAAARIITQTTKEATPSFVAPLKVQAAPVLGGRYLLESLLTLQIGNPPQPVEVILDTGSFLCTIYNSSCPSRECGPYPKYDTEASESAVVSNTSAWTAYGAGTMAGVWAQDRIHIQASDENGEHGENHNNSSSNGFTMFQNMTLINAINWTAGQNTTVWPMSGIFGLGKFDLPSIPSNTKQLSQQGIHCVATWLPRGRPFKTGKVQFGGYEQLLPPGAGSGSSGGGNNHSHTPLWMPAPEYQVKVQDVLVNNVSTGACHRSGNGATGCSAFFDTGGAAMYFSRALQGTPAGSSIVVFPCNETDSMPSITIVMKNTSFTLDPIDYVLTLPNGTCQSTILVHGEFNDNDDHNDGDVNSRVAGGERWGRKTNDIAALASGHFNTLDLGIMWSSRVLTIFDWESSRMGFSTIEN